MKQKHPVVKQGSPRYNRLGLAVGEFTQFELAGLRGGFHRAQHWRDTFEQRVRCRIGLAGLLSPGTKSAKRKTMEKSISWLEELLALQGLKANVSGNQMTGDLGDDSLWLTIDTASLSADQVTGLIGDRGKVLDSMQYLANTILNLEADEDEQRAYTLEIDGYRKTRQAALKTLADEAAEQVIGNGEDYEIKGLSSAERRQVHGLLGDYAQLETFSRGREPDRHLVVKLANTDALDESEE